MLPYLSAIGNGTVNVANMIPAIYSRKLLHKFYAKTILMQMANTDYEGEIKGQGDRVIIRTRPEVAIKDYNGSVTYDELTSGKIELAIDKAKYYAFVEDDVQNAQIDIQAINAATDDAAKKMVINIEQEVFAGIAADFLPAHTVTTTVDKTNVVDVIVHLGRLMDDSHVDDERRNLAIPPWMAEMLKTSDLKDASITGDPKSVLRNGGKLGMIDRWNIMCNTNLPFDSGTGETSVMGMTPHFLTFASQFEKHEIVQLESRFGKGHRGLKLYGYKGGMVPEAGVKLICKPAP